MTAGVAGTTTVEPSDWTSSPILYTKDGHPVITDSSTRTPGAANHWLSYAIPKVVVGARTYIYEAVEFPEVIGNDVIVETGPNDKIVYALRPSRRRYVRMVRGRVPTPTRFYTVKLKALVREPGTFVVLAGQVGNLVEMDHDTLAIIKRQMRSHAYAKLEQRVNEFWSTHAYVLGGVTYLPETLTEEPPSRHPPVQLKVGA